jgi:hypothetical protein
LLTTDMDNKQAVVIAEDVAIEFLGLLEGHPDGNRQSFVYRPHRASKSWSPLNRQHCCAAVAE